MLDLVPGLKSETWGSRFYYLTEACVPGVDLACV